MGWIMGEVQDSLAAAQPHGTCVTKTLPQKAVTAADAVHVAEAPQAESVPTTTWRYNGCHVGLSNVVLSGERHLWARDDAADMPQQHSRFVLARTRADGAVWQAAGQTEVLLLSDAGNIIQQRVLTHGTTALSGGSADAKAQHAYAYHLLTTAGVDGVEALRISGVAQLNFEALAATSQVKLSALVLSPACPWPVFGHVSIATTASDGSVCDATLMFTQACGVVKDAQGGLTTLAMPWEEDA